MQSLASVRLAMADRLQEEREWLTDCVAKLRADDRELIHRCYGRKNITAKDVAVALGRPVNTVYKALIRIRRSLYECVQRTISGVDRP
jgi:RNA polymerase sigma-70 factor (ECF subfamily)